MQYRRTPVAIYSVVEPTQFPWRAGLTQLPLQAFGALLISVAGIATSIAILIASDGVDVRHWRFQPTVYIAIASTITNISLAFALSQGICISWWSKATKTGTRIRDLHHIWDFGNNFWAAIFSGRHVNAVAVASILVALSPINGPLLQRASTIKTADVLSIQQLELKASKVVPEGYTGLYSSRGNLVNFLTTNFSEVARGYYDQADIPMQTDCVGSCSASVLGAGFHADCSSYHAPYNASEEISLGASNTPEVNIFQIEVSSDLSHEATSASLIIQFKPSAGCEGELVVRNCTLKAGTMLYPVTIDGGSSTIQLRQGTTIWDDVIVGAADSLPEEHNSGGLSTYGGLFLAIANQYNTNIQLQWGGAIAWEFWGTQSAASFSYARDIGDFPSCNIFFIDPTADLLQSMRELIFRTAVASATSNDTQHVIARATGTFTVYHTSYLFLSLATLASTIAILSVMLTFGAFWHVGRKVSMSPIETGKAFNAPMLRSANSNAPARALLSQVGARAVRYGVMSRRDHIRTVSRVDDMEFIADDSNLLTRYSPAYSDMTGDEQGQSHNSSTVIRPLSIIAKGDESDVELVDRGKSSLGPTAWLELADPQRVMSIPEHISFG